MAGFVVDTSLTLKDSVASTKESSNRSISTSLGPVSPGWNVTSTSFSTKSSSLAVADAVARLKVQIRG